MGSSSEEGGEDGMVCRDGLLSTIVYVPFSMLRCAREIGGISVLQTVNG